MSVYWFVLGIACGHRKGLVEKNRTSEARFSFAVAITPTPPREMKHLRLTRSYDKTGTCLCNTKE